MRYYSIAKILHKVNKFDDAFECFKLGAKEGCVKCNFGVALFYYNGIATEKDYEKAISIMSENYNAILELAKSGDREAMCIIGYCFSEGFYVERSEIFSKEWFKKAKQPWIKLNEKVDEYFLVSRKLYEEIEEQGIENSEYGNLLFQIASMGYMIGDFRCLLLLSYCYKNGIGIQKNEDLANSMVSIAISQCKAFADEGDVYSMYLMYLINLKAIGKEKDLKESRYWLIKASNFGDDYSLFKLGEHYLGENLYLLDNNLDLAFKYLDESAEKGNSLAIKKMKKYGKSKTEYKENDLFFKDEINKIKEKDENLDAKNKNLDAANEKLIAKLKSDTQNYLNKLENINSALYFIEKYKLLDKGKSKSYFDVSLSEYDLMKFEELNDYSRVFLTNEICKFYDDYISLKSILTLLPSFYDELHNCAKVEIGYEVKSYFFGLIKKTYPLYSIYFEESNDLLNIENNFLLKLEGNQFNEGKELLGFFRSINEILTSIGKRDNLDTMLRYAKNYENKDNLSRIFYVAEYTEKYGELKSSRTAEPLDNNLSKEFSKKYKYFTPLGSNHLKIYLHEIKNLK